MGLIVARRDIFLRGFCLYRKTDVPRGLIELSAYVRTKFRVFVVFPLVGRVSSNRSDSKFIVKDGTAAST